jgi:hypothetical protein
MKTIKFFIVILVALFTVNSSFSEQRNLSTPLSRLWGHWIDVETGIHHYFAKVSKTDESGSFIQVNPDKNICVELIKKAIVNNEGKERELTKDELALADALVGKATYRHYELFSQEPNGREVLIGTDENVPPMLRLVGQPIDWRHACLIEKNGTAMDMSCVIGNRPDPSKPKIGVLHLKYVDSKTTPEG